MTPTGDDPVLVVYDATEYEQADRSDSDAHLDRLAEERELARRRDRRGDPR